jgi:hypothetical protein
MADGQRERARSADVKRQEDSCFFLRHDSAHIFDAQTRCEGGRPCRRCREAGLECQVAIQINPSLDNPPSSALESRVAVLEANVARLEAALDGTTTSTTNQATPSRRERVQDEPDEDDLAVALGRFERFCAPYLPFDCHPDPSNRDALYWAAIAAGSRMLSPGMLQRARNLARECLARTFFAPRPARVVELHALLIFAYWLSHVRPQGYLVAQAYELGLHLSPDSFLHALRSGNEHRALELAESLRTFGHLFILERLHTFATGMPHLILSMPSLLDAARALCSLSGSTPRDTRMLAQLELVAILAGLDNAADSRSLRAITAELDSWRERFVPWASEYASLYMVFLFNSRGPPFL